jgi:CPA1 family monovalent cation:H+ antiporter
MLIVLHIPQAVHSLSSRSGLGVIKLAALVLCAIVLVRFIWIFGSVWLPRLLSQAFRRIDPASWRHTALIAWTGMRGADSLAAALSIPLSLPDNQPFPGRDLILVLTFAVIFGTLILQGLTLSPLVKWLGVVDDHASDKEERLARLKANEAALARLDQLESSRHPNANALERLRAEYTDRIRQLKNTDPHEESVQNLYSPDFESLARAALQTERETVLNLRNDEVINDQALRRIQRDIDLAEARLHRPAKKS